MIAFNQPPRQALIPSLVKEADIGSAVAIQQFLFNGTRVISPIFTGLMFDIYGEYTLAYWLASCMALLSIAAVWSVKLTEPKS